MGKGRTRPFGVAAALAVILVMSGGFAAQAPTTEGLSLTDAVILGVVEGITEYLPVSSTGHLLFTEKLLGLTDTPEAKAAADSYAIIIQFGAILAVLGLYRTRVAQVVRGLFGRDAAGLRIGVNLVLAFVPAAVVGLALHARIKHYLFGPWPVVFAWAAGGILLLIWRRGKGQASAALSLETVTSGQALLIGLFQCLALWPGMSRSLTTIVGGIVVGLPLAASVEFSFLLGGLTLTAASAFEVVSNGEAVFAAYGPLLGGLGVLVSFASAALAIKWLVSFLQKRDMAVFGWYRIAVALLAGAYLLAA